MNLKELQVHAKAEDERLREHYNYGTDERELALAYMTKITEETGELAEQVLIHLGLQRKAKLMTKKREDLEKEFADVVYATVIFADHLGIDVDKLMTERIAEIKQRNYKE